MVKETVPIPASGDYQRSPRLARRGLTIAAVSEIAGITRRIIIILNDARAIGLSDRLECSTGLMRDSTISCCTVAYRCPTGTGCVHSDLEARPRILTRIGMRRFRKWRLANVARCAWPPGNGFRPRPVFSVAAAHTSWMNLPRRWCAERARSAHSDRLRAGSGNLHSGDKSEFLPDFGLDAGNRRDHDETTAPEP